MFARSKNPRDWLNRLPKIVFYDNNYKIGEKPLYTFKGIYKFAGAIEDLSEVYLKKIGSILIIDDKTKQISWR